MASPRLLYGVGVSKWRPPQGSLTPLGCRTTVWGVGGTCMDQALCGIQHQGLWALLPPSLHLLSLSPGKDLEKCLTLGSLSISASCA